MASPLQKKILSALLVAIRPLARALMASGVSYREYAEISKTAFVQVAAADYGKRGRPTNNSRIAVITGLGRKEVKRILENSSDGSINDFVDESPASIVIHNWNNDPTYLNELGEPLILDYGDSEPSFVSLVSKYAGDIPPGAVRTELIRVNAVEEVESGGLKVVAPYFVPPGLSDRLIIGLEDGAATLLSTLAHNCDPKRDVEPRFQRVASVDGIAPEFFPEIERYAQEKLTEFGLEFCSYLDSYERKSRAKTSAANYNQLGIGLYFYELGKRE
jgi:hypothetical protein